MPETQDHSPKLATASQGLKEMVANFKQWMEEEKDLSASVHAIRALTSIITKSEATTVMGLTEELNTARLLLEESVSRHNMALSSGCDLFLRFVTRTSLEAPNFEKCKQNLIERGDRFANMSLQARKKISTQAVRFIKDGMTVLTHGFSRVVWATLVRSAEEGVNFHVIVTESQPDSAGKVMVKHLVDAGIPCTVVLDAGVARVMERADLVIVGAEGVVENGGIINKIGTYQVAMAAHSHKKRVYVVAESFKFVRLYPLGQYDLPESGKNVSETVEAPGSEFDGAFRDNSLVDYTPPAYITLLFTDLGVFTPSAVSDELIKLYA